MKKYRLYIVDMDDTLYEERQYVYSGFRVVSELAEEHLGIRAGDAHDFMLRYFGRQGRKRVFDALLEAYGRKSEPAVVEAWVQAYRNHQPAIQVYPFVEETLAALRQAGGQICIVTDGLTCMQERKFAALGLADYVDRVVYCHTTGYPKPDPRSLVNVLRHGQEDAVLIGDRPDHDLALAAHVGIDAIRVRTERFKHQANTPWQPVAEIAAFPELLRM